MVETILSKPRPKTETEYEAAIQEMFAEMDRLDESIRRKQAEIDRLKAKTRATLDEIKRM